MNLHSAAADRQTYRENTIASFRRAAAAGASFVEFDVQVGRTAQSCLAMDVIAYTQGGIITIYLQHDISDRLI